MKTIQMQIARAFFIAKAYSQEQMFIRGEQIIYTAQWQLEWGIKLVL